MTDHRKQLTRVVWHLNHSADPDLWIRYAEYHGYRIAATIDRGNYVEYRLDFDGDAVAFIHSWSDEAFLFVFAPERGAFWRADLWWRITHPTRRRTEPPWPRRSSELSPLVDLPPLERESLATGGNQRP